MIGVDIVELKRFDNFLERFKNRALKKYLDSEEISLVKNNSTAAGFFAAKEAVSKALGTGIGGECGFFDIKIHKNSKNAPFFTLSKQIIERFGISDTSLSIAHDGNYVIAVASIESKLGKNRSLCHSTASDKL